MEIRRVFDILTYQALRYPSERVLNVKENGTWKHYNTQAIIDVVNTLSLAFLDMGLEKGDKVAIMSANRPEWNFIDLAAQQIGVVSVPIYPTSSLEDCRYILQHSGSKILFSSDRQLYDKGKQAIGNAPTKLYSFDLLEGAKNWSELKETGKKQDISKLQSYKDTVQPEDLLTLIYTSGTTARPKGVMLTHSNIVSNVLAVSDRLDLAFGKDRVLSFLPLSHIYERTGLYAYLYFGLEVYYAESLEKIVENVQEIKPHGFNTVPRLLEKVYDKIVAKGKELSGIKKSLFFWAVNLGLAHNPNENRGAIYNFKLKIARKLIFSKWREALGGEIKAICSGGAALQPRLTRVFWAANIKVCEGYGLTETSPVISATVPKEKDVRVGYVGTLVKDAQVKIAEDGEILCKGPMVMKGYYREPEMTAQVLQNGWFHTGDIGELAQGKYLKITDRKKEMFKTSGGKYIAPQLLENKLKESSLIEQVMVIGENRKCPSALVVPNFEALGKWCEQTGIDISADREALTKSRKIIDKFQKEIDRANENFGQWEKVKLFRLLTEEWGIHSGELTPKMSLKRRVIIQKNQDLVEQMYQ